MLHPELSSDICVWITNAQKSLWLLVGTNRYSTSHTERKTKKERKGKKRQRENIDSDGKGGEMEEKEVEVEDERKES